MKEAKGVFMRYLEDTVHIDASPLEVWGWLCHLAENYQDWHPDHGGAEWLAGPPNRVGSIMRAVELIGDHEEELLLELVEFDPPYRYAYRIGRSIGLLLPGGAFEIEPDAAGKCWFTVRVAYRYGPFTERLFRRRVEKLRTHLAEEASNLKQIVEAAA
jgi:hypothetical protein